MLSKLSFLLILSARCSVVLFWYLALKLAINKISFCSLACAWRDSLPTLSYLQWYERVYLALVWYRLARMAGPIDSLFVQLTMSGCSPLPAISLPGQFHVAECSNPDLSPTGLVGLSHLLILHLKTNHRRLGQLPFSTHERHVVAPCIQLHLRS